MNREPTYQILSVDEDPRVAYLDDVIANVPDYFKLTKGVSLKKDVSKANTFSVSKKGGDMLCDLVESTSGVLVVSTRAREVLEAAGVTGKEVEYLPITLKDKRGRPTKQEFYLANLLRKVSCMDRDKSDFVDSDADGRILSVRRLTVLAKKIPKDVQLFRLEEYPRVFVIRSDLAEQLRKEKLTGLAFREQGERFKWRGTARRSVNHEPRADLANLLRPIPCMDRDNSKFIDADDNGEILILKVLTVQAKKVPKDALLFRLGEYPRVIVIRSDLAEQLRKQKLTGLVFSEQGKKFKW